MVFKLHLFLLDVKMVCIKASSYVTKYVSQNQHSKTTQKSTQIQPKFTKIRIKSTYLQGFCSKPAYLKCFCTQFKTAYLQGPCIQSPRISRPCSISSRSTYQIHTSNPILSFFWARPSNQVGRNALRLKPTSKDINSSLYFTFGNSHTSFLSICVHQIPFKDFSELSCPTVG